MARWTTALSHGLQGRPLTSSGVSFSLREPGDKSGRHQAHLVHIVGRPPRAHGLHQHLGGNEPWSERIGTNVALAAPVPCDAKSPSFNVSSAVTETFFGVRSR